MAWDTLYREIWHLALQGDELIVKADADTTGTELLTLPGMRPFKMGERPAMKSWFLAGDEALADDDNLVRLLVLSRDYVLTLPPKRAGR